MKCEECEFSGDCPQENHPGGVCPMAPIGEGVRAEPSRPRRDLTLELALLESEVEQALMEFDKLKRELRSLTSKIATRKKP